MTHRFRLAPLVEEGGECRFSEAFHSYREVV
jgi:hypothetical protein